MTEPQQAAPAQPQNGLGQQNAAVQQNAAQQEVVDIDGEYCQAIFQSGTDVISALPERKRLDASGVWVNKDNVEQEIKAEYRKVLRKMAEIAAPGYDLRHALEDAWTAEPKATSSKLITRHHSLWGKKIKAARAEAAKELKVASKSIAEILAEVGARHDVDRALDYVERGCIERHELACQQADKAALLIKDLQAHLAVGS